jgi:dipeptidyl aminopeptidase/acylaminoacyl peptidase
VPRPPDPVTADPTKVDTAFPLHTEELAFQSMGSRLNGFLYVANGPGPHPTVILLHGLPGNERNLDLAQALRRAGMNVLFFSYRGSWGSGGTFSFAHALEDVASAVQFVRSDSSVQLYHSDPHRTALLGHSMGGWLALMGIAADSSLRCAVALDYWNAGASGRAWRTDTTGHSFTSYGDWLTAPGAPLRADSGGALTAELEEHADQWDLERQVAALRLRPLLLVSSTVNEDHARLVAALHAAQAGNVTAAEWKTDHGFSGDRIRLAHIVISWLHAHCGL